MITIEVSGIDEILRRLQNVQKPIQETIREDLTRIAKVVEDSTYQNFIQAGRPTWPERKYEYPHPPLMKSLAMMEGALDTSQVWHHENRLHDIDIQTTDYGIYQQEGTATIEERPFANTVEEEEMQIENILYDAIEELF